MNAVLAQQSEQIRLLQLQLRRLASLLTQAPASPLHGSYSYAGSPQPLSLAETSAALAVGEGGFGEGGESEAARDFSSHGARKAREAEGERESGEQHSLDGGYGAAGYAGFGGRSVASGKVRVWSRGNGQNSVGGGVHAAFSHAGEREQGEEGEEDEDSEQFEHKHEAHNPGSEEQAEAFEVDAYNEESNGQGGESERGERSLEAALAANAAKLDNPPRRIIVGVKARNLFPNSSWGSKNKQINPIVCMYSKVRLKFESSEPTGFGSNYFSGARR